MKPIGVFYATREGQTQRVAEHIAFQLHAHGLVADLKDVRHLETDIALTNYSAAFLAASVHVGRHEREMIRFVKDHRSKLQTLPTAFIGLSLSEAGAERTTATPEQRAKSAAEVEDMLERFFENTHWRPGQVLPVAGALKYSKYNPLIRFIMTRISAKEGADTDTSKDYEYTDWVALDQFVEQFTSPLHAV